MSWRCPYCRADARCPYCDPDGSVDAIRWPEPAAAAAPSSPPAPPDPAPRSGGRPATSAAPARPAAAGAPRPSAFLLAVLPSLERNAEAWADSASDDQLEDLARRLSAWHPSTLRRLHSLVSKALAGSWARQNGQEA